MDFFSLLGVMVRRWFVVLPVLLVALVAGLAFIGSPAERYTAEGSELLGVRSEADPESLDSRQIEPTVAATVLATALGQPSMVRNLTADDLSGSVVASVDRSGTILTLTVTSGSAEEASRDANRLLELAPSLLEDILGADASASILLTSLGAPGVADAVEVNGEYVLTTYMSVLPPTDVRNPFPPDNSTAQLLVELSRRTELLDAVNEAVPGGQFEVQVGGAIATPLVAIRATAGEPNDVASVYDVVVEQLEAQLVERQERVGVREAEQTVLYPLVEPTLVERASSSTVRAAAGVALLGLAAAAVLAIVVDSWLKRRRERNLGSTDLDPLVSGEVQDHREEMAANS